MTHLPARFGPALAALSCAVFCAVSPVAADPVAFDGSWRKQGFLRLFSNSYVQKGAALDVVSDGTVSLLWRAVPEALRGARAASWAWQVQSSVPATDLTQKGGDDRNLALYFVYTDPETAASLNPNRARRLLQDPNTRALVYIWGGNSPRGAVLPSPYHAGLRSLILRPAGTGSFAEQVDLNADYRKAFGTAPGVLVGLGITADSDDTDSRIAARVQNLDLR